MRRTIILLFVTLALLASACEEAPKGEVYVGDTPYRVYFTSFSINCDTEKKLAIAYTWAISEGGSESSERVGGLLSDEQYAKWCERAVVDGAAR